MCRIRFLANHSCVTGDGKWEGFSRLNCLHDPVVQLKLKITRETATHDIVIKLNRCKLCEIDHSPYVLLLQIT